MTILFLYVVGYLIGVGISIEDDSFSKYGIFITLLGLLVAWPIDIGIALRKQKV